MSRIPGFEFSRSFDKHMKGEMRPEEFLDYLIELTKRCQTGEAAAVEEAKSVLTRYIENSDVVTFLIGCCAANVSNYLTSGG